MRKISSHPKGSGGGPLSVSRPSGGPPFPTAGQPGRVARPGETVSLVVGGAAVPGVPLAARRARLLAAELVGVPTLVRCPPAQAGDLALALRVHRGEAAQAPALGRRTVALCGIVIQCHVESFRWWVKESSCGKVRARPYGRS